MTLSRRAFRVILPVVILGNILVALTIYWIERDNIEQAEIAQLSRQMERLKTLFDEDVEFTRNLVFLLRVGDAVRSFVREADDSFRATAIGVKVQDGIEFFSAGAKRFVSFAILENDLSVTYYFERSDDPFASIPLAQLDAARALVKGSGPSSNEFAADEGQPLLIHTELIDRTTFSTAFATQRQSAIVLQSAVRPHAFLKMKADLEAHYGEAVTIARNLARTGDGFVATATLLPHLEAGLRLSEAYLSERFRPLLLTLGAGCLALSFASIGLLLFLIRRTITGPIAALDSRVTDVLAGRRQSLDRMTGAGEIERLSTNIKTLHDQALDTLAKVQEASWTDSLTGVSNRLRFSLLGGSMLERAERAREKLSLLFIDLDNFKFVNDTFGHAAGDAVLRRFTDAVKDILAETVADGRSAEPPLLARLSGDEFAILLPETADVQQGQSVAAKIVARFQDGLAVGADNFSVSASIGIACFPDDALSFTELISCADRAMYRAKAVGKSGIARYSREFAESEQRLEQIKGELRRLDPDEEFSLVYMPIVSRQGVVTKCEALLRWSSPRLGAVSPGEFIPVAEANALFSKVDRWVLDKAVGDLRALQAVFGRDLVLNINISAAELSSRAIVDHAVEAIRRHGVHASSIELEVTETFAMKAPARAKTVVQSLKEAGFRLSLDDFGSGYTSLKQILEFPLDTVKLDGELVARIHDAQGKLALSSIIDLCHSQNCQVVAEGVEDRFTQAALMLVGCDLFQGFGIHRPVPVADLVSTGATAGRPTCLEMRGVIGH
ncbi:putative bifunctional diguanylate cyclase/phosphodiesterase [Shinella pollutisoli]|uniref:Bifunctional diguanylate cyclase/phosphodiesterase n=1 Tax=Shinella pollutisoli TaxID=2250594 RepID=A0ABV7DEY2_9HYPH|nr:bifunctional diguanylate cyclase/phosphodiesterase [Shinella pollutisoli]